MRARSVLTCLLALAACASERPPERSVEPATSAPRGEPQPSAATPPAPVPVGPEDPGPAPQASAPAPASPPAWEGASALVSNAGTYRVLYRTTPAAIERGKPFALDVWVFAAGDPATALRGVELHADAAMPEHGHGMNRVPTVARREDGGLHVEGMLFHMLGLWQLYLDVVDGPLAERAQVDVELE